MTSHSIITTRAQSRALEEHQEALNAPSTSRNDLAEEGEFLSFSNRNTPPGAPAPDPTTPTPALCHPNKSGVYSTRHFDNVLDIYGDGYPGGDGGGGGDSNPPSPNPPDVPLPDSPIPSTSTPTPDPLLLFAQAVQALTKVTMASADRDSSSGHTKVREPDTFDGTDLHKLRTFLVQCELNFQDHPKAFTSDCARVTFAQSYLKGMALEWFEPDLLNSANPRACPLWMDNYAQFVSELKSNFGPHDPIRDTEHQLDNLSMKEGQKINKYVVKFNHLAGQVHGYGNGALCHIFYSGLPDRIKDKISRVGKPRTLDGYHTLVQTIDTRYWERKSEVACQTKTSTSSTSNSASKGNSSASSNSKGKTKEKDNKNKSSDKSKSSSGAKPASSKTPTHLGKDGKLTEEERQWRIKDKLCMFCRQPGHMARDCQDHVQLRTLIRLLRSHCSTVAQLQTSAHYSGPGRAHTLPLSATLCIRLNPVVTTLPRLPCCTVSSPCSVCIFYLVVFSPDLTYFHRT